MRAHRCSQHHYDQPLNSFLWTPSRSRNACSKTSPKKFNAIPSRSEWDIDTRLLFILPMSLAFVLYLNTLSAGFVYDDHRAIASNPDVIGTTPLSSIWKHDFWGAPLSRKGSHGSWRPITILTFRLNALLVHKTKNRDLSYEIDSQPLPPYEAWHFHAVNILLHTLVTGVYVAMLLNIGSQKMVCLLASTLFAVHPVHVEAVSGLVGRAELLAGLAFCMALGAYSFYIQEQPCGSGLKSSVCICLSSRNVEMKALNICSSDFKGLFWFILSVSLATIGLMCKEQAITALGVCFILHLALIILSSEKKNLLKHVILRTWPICSVIVVLISWRIYMSSPTPSFSLADNPAAHAPSLRSRILTILKYWTEDSRLFLFPNALSFDWSADAVPLITSFSESENFFSLFLLLGLISLCVSSIRSLWEEHNSRQTLSLHSSCHDVLNNNQQIEKLPRNISHNGSILSITSLAMLLIPFLPASNIFAWVGFTVAERVLYIPSMGYSLMVGHGAYLIFTRYSEWNSSRIGYKNSSASKVNNPVYFKIVMATIWCIVIVSMAARTVIRNMDWKSDEHLFKSGIKNSPAKAYANLGVVYSDQGRLHEAEAAYREALKHDPAMPETHYNLGLLLENANRLEESRKCFQEALQCRLWFVQAHLALASTLFKIGRPIQASQVLRHCIAHQNAPAKDGKSHSWTVVSCRQRLIRSHLSNGMIQEAFEELQKTLKSIPLGYPMHSILTLQAEVLSGAGEHAEAEDVIMKALRSQPTHIPAHLAYSKLLQANGSKVDEAELWLRKASSIEPSDPHVLKHLGQLLLDQGRAKEAIEPWLKASHLDPMDHTSAFNTATSLRLAGQNQQAEIFYRKAVKLQPNDVASQRNLGAILHLNGKLKDAQHHYHIALSLSPGDPQTTTNLKRLASLMKKKPL